MQATVHLVDGVAVIGRVRVDQATDGAMLGGDFRFDAAPRIAVSREDDRALDRNAAAIEIVIVLRPAVVDVDDWPGHIAIDRVGVERRQLLVLLRRGRILRNRRLLEFQREGGWRHHFHEALFRRREEHVVRFQPCIPPPFLELREDPLRVVLVVGRAEVMRSRAHPLDVVADVLWIRNRAELRVPPGVLRRHRRRKRDSNGQRQYAGDGLSRPPDHLFHFQISYFVFQTLRIHGTA